MKDYWNTTHDQKTGLEIPISPEEYSEKYMNDQEEELKSMVEKINDSLMELCECIYIDEEDKKLDTISIQKLQNHYEKYGWKVTWLHNSNKIIMSKIKNVVIASD